jgi:hypothetical protein
MVRGGERDLHALGIATRVAIDRAPSRAIAVESDSANRASIDSPRGAPCTKKEDAARGAASPFAR